MTTEILKAKGNSVYHFFCDKPILIKPARNEGLLISGRHLIFKKVTKEVLNNTFIYNTKK